MIFARVIVASMVATLLFMSYDVAALGLKLAPLEYKTVLGKDERKRGFIDISNPAGQSLKVKTDIQAFRQIDDNGGLQFYESEQTKVGIVPELKEFELGPREAVRMYFTIDGANLPEGDVFAAIFFTTELEKARSGVGQLVRVGTLLSIVNTTPGSRAGEVTRIGLPFLQFSKTMNGSYSVKNNGPTSSGFYPVVKIVAHPGTRSMEHQAALVFGGRERNNDFNYDVGYGIHWVEIGYGDSKKGQLVITLAPWMLVLALLVILIVGVEILLLKRRRKKLVENTTSERSSTPEN